MDSILNIKSDFYWLGALDPNLRTFDIVMETEFGTTYNSYLLKGSNGVVLFDTVKECFFDVYLNNLKELTPLDKIKYIVINHTEPDHAGSLAKLIPLLPHAIIVGSATAIKYLTQILNFPFSHLIIKENETINLGNKTIRFISVPQLHWPDTIYSYIEEDNILVTCDSFGAHYSNSKLLRSLLTDEESLNYDSAYKYYFDMIMGPFKPFVLKALDKLNSLPLEFICPGHGMILEKDHISSYLSLYKEWSIPKTLDSKIVIAYVSAYGYTKSLAESIKLGISSNFNGEIVLLDLEKVSIPEAMNHINSSKALLLGSPTILADALPPVWSILINLNPLLHKHLTVGVFGSYGWSGEAISNITDRFKQLKCKMPLEPFKCIFRPSQSDTIDAQNFGANFATYIK